MIIVYFSGSNYFPFCQWQRHSPETGDRIKMAAKSMVSGGGRRIDLVVECQSSLVEERGSIVSEKSHQSWAHFLILFRRHSSFSLLFPLPLSFILSLSLYFRSTFSHPSLAIWSRKKEKNARNTHFCNVTRLNVFDMYVYFLTKWMRFLQI